MNYQLDGWDALDPNRDQSEQQAEQTQGFIELRPEYYVCKRNGDLMLAWFEARGVPYTLRNLELAFQELHETLEPRPAEPRGLDQRRVVVRKRQATEVPQVRLEQRPAEPEVEWTTGQAPLVDDTAEQVVESLSESALRKLSLSDLKKRADADRLAHRTYIPQRTIVI